MKDLNENILNNQGSYSSEKDEYTFTVGTGKHTKNVILKLDIDPEDDISNETVANLLEIEVNDVKSTVSKIIEMPFNDDEFSMKLKNN